MIQSSTVQQMQQYMQAQMPCYIEELRAFCAIDSGTYYKRGLDESARYLATHMHRYGMDVQIIKNEDWGNDVLGTLHGAGTGCITLLGHIDTVYPEGTASARPLRIMPDGKLLAPGAADMKGCILMSLYAIKALLAVESCSFGEIRLLCVSDEEISKRHSVDLIQQACRGCDEVLVLEAARANGDIVSARKGTAWYRLAAQGCAAHVGVEPEKGRNAILELAHQILQFQQLHGWREGLSICPGVISGGTSPNVIPESAQTRIDLRYLHPFDRVLTENRWREMLTHQYIAGVKLILEVENFGDPMLCTSKSLKLAQLAHDIAQMLGFSLNHVLSGGTSDARFASALGLPVLDGLGPIGGCDHSLDEYILLESVPPRTALLAGLIAESGAA